MAEQTLTEIRVYVGGLGEKVTEQEMKSTFSNLGNVKSVELIRSKGRSFAYINFFPSSTNSLAKLYSTYNGCSWKGGKLKLEKAKEHYLDRLKREWAEEEELKNSELSHAELIKNSEPKIPSKLDLENMEFRLFFPKLRKLKPLSLTGTGKHKYSFRRLEGPPIPVHFCDCPEHSVPVQTRAVHTNVSDTKKGGVNKKEYNRTTPVTNKFIHRETSSDHRGIANHDSVIQDDGMNEEEINMIDSVMKKLLDRGTSTRRDREILPFSQQKTGTSEIEEVNDDDDDDIKINAVSVQNYSLGLERHESLSNEDTNDIEDETDDDDDDIQINVVSRRKLNQTRSSNEITTLNENIESLNKKRKSISIETNATDTKSPINEKKSMLNIPLKKSPWKQLIADASNSSFTLSQITSENDISHINSPKLRNKESSSNVKKGKKVDQEDNKKKKRKSHKIASEEPNLIDEVPAVSEEYEQENSKKSNLACEEAPAGSEEREEDMNYMLIENQSSKQNKNRKKPSKVQPEEVKPSNESPAGIEEHDVDPPATQPSGVSNKVIQGSSWFQKSTWTELVGGGANSSFSLSKILPGDLVQKQRSDKPDAFSNVSFTSTGASKGETSKERTFDFGSLKPSLDVRSEEMEIRSSVPKPIPSYLARGVQISETCPFMKNDDSVKEWMAAKTAVKKSLKKLAKQIVNP